MNSQIERMVQFACQIRAGRDGVRRSRWLILCQNMEQIRQSAKEIERDLWGAIQINRCSFTATVRLPLPDDTKVLAEIMWFRYTDKRYLCIEVTGGWCEGCPPPEAQWELKARSWRYPAVQDFVDDPEVIKALGIENVWWKRLLLRVEGWLRMDARGWQQRLAELPESERNVLLDGLGLGPWFRDDMDDEVDHE